MIRVIIVDDEEDALDLLEILLGQIGGVDIVGRYINPAKAFETLNESPIDLVFLDIDMPGMKGTELAREIRKINKKIPIVFTTAYSEYAVEAFEIQTNDYLLKPFTLDRLQTTVIRIQQALTVSAAQERSIAHLSCSIQCFGGFHLQSSDTGKSLLSWKTKKVKELCAFLVHHEGKPVSTASIIEALWPEYDLNKAKTYLYTCLSYLRRNLAENNVPIIIQKVDQGFAAMLGELVADFIEFKKMISSLSSEGNLDQELYKKINALYKGEYMEACDFDWAAARQMDIKEMYIHELRKWYKHFYSMNETVLALDSLQRILAILPDSEREGRELIQLHLKLGNRSEALRVCERLEKTICVQLGTELEAETLSLLQQVREKTAGQF